jgi:hypothetical protein
MYPYFSCLVLDGSAILNIRKKLSVTGPVLALNITWFICGYARIAMKRSLVKKLIKHSHIRSFKKQAYAAFGPDEICAAQPHQTRQPYNRV